ncbi:MAG TPA: TolC family protein [Acidobacteriaceae bacterium]|jgi:outer membrane protein TolC|nr:TolC family protein [Acidobacteriaceae bacterium]
MCLAVCALLGEGRAQAPPQQQTDKPLTLDEVIQRAEANQPGFAAAAAESRATALERTDARAGLLPSVTYHNQYLFTQSNQTQAATTQGGLSQSLPLFIANNAVHEYYSQGVVNEQLGLAQIGAVRLAEANAARAQAELEVARRGLVTTVVTLYYTVASGGTKVQIAQRALDEANRFADVTEKREAAREAAHADVIKARLGQEQRQRELDEATLAAEKASLELGVLLFPDPTTKFTLEPAGAPPMLPDLQSVEAAAKQNNPELRSAMASLQVSKAETLNARAALLPDLSLQFMYGIDAPQFAKRGPDGARNLGYSAGATLDIPIWDWLTTERKVKEANIRANAAKLTVTTAQRRLVATLAEDYDEAEVARRELASLDASVADARESLRLTNLRYVNGEGTVLEVVDAENTLISAEDAQIDGEVRYRTALAQLQTLAGRF